MNYAKELIRIGHDYLEFSLSSGDAYDRIQEVQERLSNYCEESEYSFDSDISHIAYGMDGDVLLQNDSEVLKTIQKLQGLIDGQNGK